MPPRWICLVILLFWAGFNGYLFFHDLLPRLLPHQPPPYTIDLTEEAQLRGRRPYIEWTVYCDDEKVFRAQTSVAHPGYNNASQHDVFEMKSQFKPLQVDGEMAISGFKVKEMTSVYRVNAAGDLLGLSVHVEAWPDAPEKVAQIVHLLGGHPAKTRLALDIQGEVVSGRLRPEVRVTSTIARPIHLPFPEVPISRGGSVLLPLHPV